MAIEHFPYNTESNNPKDTEQLIADRLNLAQNNALEEDEMQELLQRKNILESQHDPDNVRQLEKINALLSERVVIVPTLSEYKILLEKTGLPQQQVIDLLAHENAHANKAESLDANFGGYTLLVWKGKDGYKYLPFALTSVDRPADDFSKSIEKEIEIANAPEEYGNATSADDKRRIEELRKQLNLE